MRKTIQYSILFLLCLVSNMLHAEPAGYNYKNAISIVKPVITDEQAKFMESYAMWLSRLGYRDASRMTMGLKNNATGTAFITENEQGKKQIITVSFNVGIAKEITVEFQNDNGIKTIYTTGNAVAKNNGLIAFDVHQNITAPALPLSKDNVFDGDDIFTMGYTRIDEAASWSISNGIVSNSRYNNDVLGLELTQHTSPLNTGLYGSPLLMKNDKSVYGYDVVGVNLFKGRERENTGYAIPNDIVNQFIANIDSTNKNKESLSAAVGQFIHATPNDFRQIKELISNDFLMSQKSSTLQNWFLTVPDTVKTMMEIDLEKGEIFEGAKNIIAYAFIKETFENKQATIQDITYNENSYIQNVFLKMNGKETETAWIYENGNWKIKQFGEKNKESEKEEDSDKGTDLSLVGINKNHTGIQLLLGTTILPDTFSHFEFSINFTSKPFMRQSLDFGYSTALVRLKIPMDESIYWEDPYVLHSKARMFSFAYSFNGQVPINLKRFFITPYIGAGVGFMVGKAREKDIETTMNFYWDEIEETVGGFFIKGRAGSEWGYHINSHIDIVLTTAYQINLFLNPSDDYKIQRTVNGFNTQIGVMFNH